MKNIQVASILVASVVAGLIFYNSPFNGNKLGFSNEERNWQSTNFGTMAEPRNQKTQLERSDPLKGVAATRKTNAPLSQEFLDSLLSDVRMTDEDRSDPTRYRQKFDSLIAQGYTVGEISPRKSLEELQDEILGDRLAGQRRAIDLGGYPGLEFGNLVLASKAFFDKMGYFPEGEGTAFCNLLATISTNASESIWPKHLIRRDGHILDLWRMPVEISGWTNGGIQVVSAGPDRTFNTSDDLVVRQRWIRKWGHWYNEGWLEPRP